MKRFSNIAFLLILILGIYACAKIGSPYGGPKDEEPPKVLKARPLENSVNFIPQKKITLQFDEYIALKNIMQELLISPPLEERITATVKGKSVVIEFPPEAVFDSTTYTISFGDAITDYNEGNILENYKYIFSLTDHIDSMNIDGNLLSAFNHEPDEDRMLVMLYSKLGDSVPMLEKPDYIGRTDKEGKFSINRIRPGEYRIFALKDANMNMLYDLPNEQIAFGDSIIELTPEKFQEDMIIQDTAVYDSLTNANTPTDTLAASLPVEDTVTILVTEPVEVVATDSLIITESAVDSILTDTTAVSDSILIENYYTYHTELRFFVKETYTQYLTDYTRPRRELLSFTFNEKPQDTVEIFPLNYVPETAGWYMLDASEDRDSLQFWITDTAMLSMDSLQFEFCYPMLDSMNLQYFRRDSLWMIWRDDVETGKKTRGKPKDDGDEPETEKKKEPLMVKHNITKTSAFDMNRELVLISPSPLESFVADSLHLYRIQDTLEFEEPFKVFRDSSSYYHIIIDYTPEEETKYRFFAPDRVIRDIYGNMNDTLEYRFTTKAMDTYSAMAISIKNIKEPVILQLLNSKQEVYKERYLTKDGKERLEYLTPGSYTLKLIVDRNGNQEWDTGDYLERLQPEEVLYYKDPIDLRANWELEYLWELE